jgi:hypothetical protein
MPLWPSRLDEIYERNTGFLRERAIAIPITRSVALAALDAIKTTNAQKVR